MSAVAVDLPAGCEPICHACPHRRLDAAASAAQKQGYLTRVLAPWADRLEPLAHPAARWGYRAKVSLNARWDAVQGWRFGLIRREGREELFIPIPQCPIHAPHINALVARLAAVLPPAAEFPLAYLVVSGAQATLIVKAHATATGWIAALAPELERAAAAGGGDAIEGLWLHLHPSAGRRLFARSGWSLLWGVPRSRDARGLVHGPTAFAQAIPDLHARALDRAEAFLAPTPRSTVIDLCSGVGSSLQRWRAAAATAVGVELSGEAVECAAINAPGAQLWRGTSAQRLPQLREWFAAGRPPPLVYANPPRLGLEPEVLEWLIELAPSRLAYLSCSAGTLARDLAALTATGQRVAALAPFDFFPQTQHVEVLALLER